MFFRSIIFSILLSAVVVNAQSISLINPTTQNFDAKLVKLTNKKKAVAVVKKNQKKPTNIPLQKLNPKSRKLVKAYFGGRKSEAFKSLTYAELKTVLMHDQIHRNSFTKEAFVGKKWEYEAMTLYGHDEGRSAGFRITFSEGEASAFKFNEDGTFDATGKLGKVFLDKSEHKYTLNMEEKTLKRKNLTTKKPQTYLLRIQNSKLYETLITEENLAVSVSEFKLVE